MRALMLVALVLAGCVEAETDTAALSAQETGSHAAARRLAEAFCDAEWCDVRSPPGRRDLCVSQWVDALCSLTGCKGDYAGPAEVPCELALGEWERACTCWPRHTEGRVCGGGEEAGVVPAACNGMFLPKQFP